MEKERLRRYRQNRIEITQLREEIETLRDKLTAPGTQRTSGMPTTHTGRGDQIASGIARLESLRERYDRKIAALCKEQQIIEDAISKVGGEDAILLRYRYIMGYRWEAICVKMGVTAEHPMEWSTVHFRHRRALRRIAEISDANDNGGGTDKEEDE